MKVLVIDDDSDFLEQSKIFLEHIDPAIEAETASSILKVLSKNNEEDFDAVVCDYYLPGLDGLEYLRVLREEKKSDIPFIMFTGRGSEEVAMHALNLGADRYIIKNGDPKQKYKRLAETIKELVEDQ